MDLFGYKIDYNGLKQNRHIYEKENEIKHQTSFNLLFIAIQLGL